MSCPDGFNHVRMGFGDGFGYVLLLKGSDKGTPHDTDGEHSDAGDRIERKGSSLGNCSDTTPNMVGQKKVLPIP